ncbi:MAG: hypothetical protein ACRDYY_13850 [Acidimicrobiales bacterium]
MPDPIGDLSALARLIVRLPTEARALLAIAGAGMMSPERPDRLYAMYRAVERYGVAGGAVSVAALRHGERPGLVDEAGTLGLTDPATAQGPEAPTGVAPLERLAG